MKKIISKFLSIIISMIMIISLVVCMKINTFATENKTVKVGFFAYPGYHEINDNKKGGYGYDFLQLLKRYTSLNFEFVGYDQSWEDMQQMLLDGEIDLVTSARKNPERELKFDFSEPIGTNSAQIDVRFDDDRFIPGDYTALNGKTIGELTGNSRNADLEAFALEKGFSYSIKEYETADDLEKALRNGVVDAIATSSLRKSSNEKTVAEFAPEDFHVIVKKGNSTLLNEINYGISQMDINEGNWRDDLYYNNYKINTNTSLNFTSKELAYIKAVQNGEKIITVTSRPDRDPNSFVQNGELVGIVPDYFSHLMKMCGLTYKTVIPKDYAEYQSWFKSNYTDVVLDCRYDKAQDTDMDFGLTTDSYMQLTTSRVTRKDFNGQIKTVAIVENYGRVTIDDNLARDADCITVDSPENALKAVKDGKADACYIYTHLAVKYVNSDASASLQATALKDPIYNQFIYVSPNADHELCSILNKCIKADAAGTIDEYINKYTMVSYDNLTFGQYLKLHPILIILGCVAISVVIIGAILFFYNITITKNKNTQMKKELDRLGQIKGLASQFAILYLVNLDTLETENYYLLDGVSPEEAKDIDKSSENFFEAFKKSMVIYARDDYREEMLKYANPEYVKSLLKDKRRHEFRFPCMDATGKYVWTDMVMMKFSQKENDKPVEIAVGYYNTDDEMRERIEAYNRSQRDLEAIRGLAEEYDSLEFVDLDEDTYSQYYMIDYTPEKARDLATKGQSFSKFHNESMDAFCHPDYMEELKKFSDCSYLKQLLADTNKYSMRFLCLGNDGYKWCEIDLIRLDKEESPKRIAIGYKNIDDIVKNEQEHQKELTDALEKAEKASHAKTEFLFNMSHDIRTPMNAILGYTDIALKHQNDQQKITESLKKIKVAGGHLLSLINDILEMSRIEAGRLELVNAPINVSNSCDAIIHMSKALAATKDINFVPYICEIKHPYIYADELHINEIVINLISNAIKYTENGGTVEYHVEEIEDPREEYIRCRLSVKDNGIGMSKEFQQHLFESFSRENTATVSKQEGAGLGLAIVKRILDLAGGTISVDSKKGVGSTFTVEIPFKVMNESEISKFIGSSDKNEIISNTSHLEGRRVLVCEDNEMNREIAIDILHDAGLIIDTAEDGSVAVKLLDKKGPDYYDFILMDIQMPIMNGYEATKKIRNMYPESDIPIIALSANAFAEDVQASHDAGMNDHISKPINISELIQCLEKYLK